jgi:minor histocompatibility antigen H13
MRSSCRLLLLCLLLLAAPALCQQESVSTAEVPIGKVETATPAVPLSQPNSIFIAYAALLTMAAVPIWIGSHRALQLEEQAETMSTKDAYMFPVYGSGVLFGLYILFKLKFTDYLVPLLTVYFTFLGTFALATMLGDFLSMALPHSTKLRTTYKWTPPLIGSYTGALEGSKADLYMIPAALLICYWYFQTKHWVANNIFGLAFSVQGIQLLNLGSYVTGFVLLSGLFFYDIFWVFGTEVMVKVATNLEAPIKVVFPKNLPNILAEAPKLSMLGLGDIVIPGIFLALMLKFDQARHAGTHKKKHIHWHCVTGTGPPRRPWLEDS